MHFVVAECVCVHVSAGECVCLRVSRGESVRAHDRERACVCVCECGRVCAYMHTSVGERFRTHVSLGECVHVVSVLGRLPRSPHSLAALTPRDWGGTVLSGSGSPVTSTSRLDVVVGPKTSFRGGRCQTAFPSVSTTFLFPQEVCKTLISLKFSQHLSLYIFKKSVGSTDVDAFSLFPDARWSRAFPSCFSRTWVVPSENLVITPSSLLFGAVSSDR